jgi:hypothetical protein
VAAHVDDEPDLVAEGPAAGAGDGEQGAGEGLIMRKAG